MPIQSNFLERSLFFGLNLAPAPILDLAGALSYQTLATAASLGLFQALQERPLTPSELAQQLETQERGTQALLQALAAIGYVNEKEGRYANTPMTAKWLLGDDVIDMTAAVTYWSAALGELWPHSQEIIRTGKRPYLFYEWVEECPERSRAFQQMMVSGATLAGPDIARKLNLPATSSRLLDVGGGHGMFSIILCQRFPNLQATIVDSPSALESARQNVDKHQMVDRIHFMEGDLWQAEWGQDYDLVLLFNLLHHFDLEANGKLLQMAAAALKPGGQVAILDQIEGKVTGSAANAFVQLVALQYYLFADGRIFSSDDINGLLAQAGFNLIRFHRLARSPGNSLATATKVHS